MLKRGDEFKMPTGLTTNTASDDGPSQGATIPRLVTGRMGARGTYLLAAALATLITVGCGTASSTKVPSAATSAAAYQSNTEDATRVEYFEPTTRHGALKAGFGISKQVGRGRCEPSSVVGGDAYRCTSADGLYDPCWPAGEAPGASSVYCIGNPWSREVTRIRLLERLQANARGRSAIWAMELASGKQCVALQGTVNRVNGTPITFSCGESGRLELLGEPYMAKASWRIREVYLHSHGYTYSHTYGPIERIAVAWYGLAAGTVR